MKDIVVILDAGHGKETPGKRSPMLEGKSQLLEYEFNRDICNRICLLLLNENIKCIFTNPGDLDMSLSERAELINHICEHERECEYFPIMISVHGNASGKGDWMKAKGWEVYSTPRENNSDKLANCFCEVFEDIFPNEKLRGHKEAEFTVIKKTNCPCVLTENFFYDNKDDYELMMSEEGRENIALLHVEAIKKFKSIL